MSAPATRRRSETGLRAVRYRGVDLARGLGLIAVFVAHTDPIDGSTPWPLKALIVSENVAAPLFTLMLGVSFGLMARVENATQHAWALRGRMLVRAGLLIVLGLGAGLLGARVLPILQYFGVVTLVLLVVVNWRPVALLAFAAAMAIVSPVLLHFVPRALAGWRAQILAGSGPEPAWFPILTDFADFVFTGSSYRVSGLLVFALVGLAVALAGVDRRVVRVAAVVGGALLVAVAYPISRLTGITAAAYSGSVLELAGATGLALLVLAACLSLYALVDREPRPRAAGFVAAALSPAETLGMMTLTFYLLHIVVLAVWTHTTGLSDDSWLMMLALIVGSLVGAALWRRFVGKGPFERLMSLAVFHR